MKKRTNFSQERHLTLTYKNYAKNSRNFSPKTPNIALQKLYQKNSRNSSHKKHLTLPYRSYAKKNKIAQIRVKKAPNTILEKLYQEKNLHILEPKKKKSRNTSLQNLF